MGVPNVRVVSDSARSATTILSKIQTTEWGDGDE